MKEYIPHKLCGIIMEVQFIVSVRREAYTISLGYVVHFPDMNDIGAPKEMDVSNIRLLVGPGETLRDKELIVTENHEAIDASHFDLNFSFFLSGSP
jgi:hypothetical protein